MKSRIKDFFFFFFVGFCLHDSRILLKAGELVARLRDDGTGGAEHGPPGMDQLVGLVPAG